MVQQSNQSGAIPVAGSRFVEFDYLKIFALFLLIFVHSDLIISFPNVMYPVEWVLLSSFFFVSGFLAYDSFHRRGDSIRGFFKPKALSLYIPFMVATVFYFFLEVDMGFKGTVTELISQVSMLNIFNGLNTICNWGFLWFIPYLLVFMLILCLLEKYAKSTKIQLLIVSVLWLSTIFFWVYNTPMELGQLFSQYLLVFTFGFWINKLKIYERIMNFKMASIAVPSFASLSLVAFFSADFSDLFTFNNAVDTFKTLLSSFSYEHHIQFEFSFAIFAIPSKNKNQTKRFHKAGCFHERYHLPC